MALKKVTQQDIENLSRLCLEARKRLLEVILNPDTGVGTKTYYNSIVRQLTKELNALSKASTRFIDTTIPREYRDGLKEIYTYFRKHKLVMKDPSAFASIHTDAAYEIAREMQYQIHTGLQTVGRQVMRYANLSRDEALRQVGLHQTGLKIASGGTITDMRAAMIRELQDNGFMTVQYGSGPTSRQVAIDVYASMVARSTSREAGNTARLNQLIENGYDLVIMTSHYPTCAKCAPLQGRAFSISGNDKRFPPLSVAFGAYNNVHPNCRHSVHPWIEALKSPEEIAQAIEFSNQPFDDPREQKEIALYKKQQDDGRRMRNDLYQWERYKTFLGDDAPKTFSAFRRIKNAGGESYGRLQAKYKAMGYYNKAIDKEPEITQTVIETAESLGMEPVGLDFRIKSKASYLRNVDSKYNPTGNEYEVKDILRYTYTAPPNELSEKAVHAIDAFSGKGYNTIEIKNTWTNPMNPYKGINTTIISPDGQKFEMQYHTPESFALKDGELHKLYEQWRLLPAGDPAQKPLELEMQRLSESLTYPDGIERVK